MSLEDAARSLHSVLRRGIGVGVLVLVGCVFDPTSKGSGGGPELVDDDGTGDDPAVTGTATSEVMTGDGDDSGDGLPTTGPDDATDGTTGEPFCGGPAGCDPATPFCAPDGTCQDGSEGDPCAEGQCQEPLVCGPQGQCQDGGEGDPCAGVEDCGDLAPVCSSGGQCQDGSEGDPCGALTDCGPMAPVCSSGGQCQDGSEGDPCGGAGDCDPAVAPICSPDSQCQDGSEGDSCNDGSDCGSMAPHCAWDGNCHDGSRGDPCWGGWQCDGECWLGSCT